MGEAAAMSSEATAEILAAVLCALEEGIAVLDGESRVLLWNPAAEVISGYLAAELISRTLPANFWKAGEQRSEADSSEGRVTVMPLSQLSFQRPVHVSLRHRRGHSLPAMLRRMPLRDALGRRFGMLMRFHPVEETDLLPHGESEDDGAPDRHIEQSQLEMEERLGEAWGNFVSHAAPMGLCWISVDQAQELRKTHGQDAHEAMLEIAERTLAHALHPEESLGRWGVNEFLVLCHERSEGMLQERAERLAAAAKGAELRWWGDRLSLTVSIGTAQAEAADSLRTLLERAQRAMRECMQEAIGPHSRA